MDKLTERKNVLVGDEGWDGKACRGMKMPVDNIFFIHMPTLSSFAASSSHAAKENAEKIDMLSFEMFMLSDVKEGLG